MQLVLTPELLLEAYRHGLFPMAYSADSPYIHWICPDLRGQLSIKGLHIPKRLKRILKKNRIKGVPYEVRIDTAFADVIKACAEKHESRPETWINAPIIKAYCALHKQGHAHSVECWQDNKLVGGLYGLAMGGAFFGESMFSRKKEVSKIALVHLVARLWAGGFTLLDTQFVNDHLKQFGVYEIPHGEYKIQLAKALKEPGDFYLKDRTENEILNSYLEMRDSEKT